MKVRIPPLRVVPFSLGRALKRGDTEYRVVVRRQITEGLAQRLRPS